MQCEILDLDFNLIQLKFGLVNHEVQSFYLLEYFGKMMHLSKLIFFLKYYSNLKNSCQTCRSKTEYTEAHFYVSMYWGKYITRNLYLKGNSKKKRSTDLIILESRQRELLVSSLNLSILDTEMLIRKIDWMIIFFFISNVESSAFSFPMLYPGFILLVIKNIPVWVVELQV